VVPANVPPGADAAAGSPAADGTSVDGASADASPVDGGALVRMPLAEVPPAYVRGALDESESASRDSWDTGSGPPAPGAAHARALQIELAPPPPSVARSLHLTVGELVVTVTVSFEDPATHLPVALTTTMLRPDLFRIVIRATAAPTPAGDTDGFAASWTHTVQGWEP
jgi:hypothetical protein